MVKKIYWKAGKSEVAIVAFVSMAKLYGTAKSQVRAKSSDDGSSFFVLSIHPVANIHIRVGRGFHILLL